MINILPHHYFLKLYEHDSHMLLVCGSLSKGRISGALPNLHLQNKQSNV